MASIRTSLELIDNITSPLLNITSALNMTISSFEDMQEAANNSFDSSSLESARDYVNQATIAVNELTDALNEVVTPEITPTASPVQEPVEVPITWRSDTFDIFTNTGIDRFQQEIQSTNNMLNTLNSTQEQIANQARNTDLFPDNMVNDLNAMTGRIQRIQSQIQQIESNPMNLGTDLANSQLEELRMQLSQAIDQQEDLNQAIERMDINEANQAYMRLSQTVGNTERYIRDNVDAQGQFNQQIRDGTSAASSLENKILAMAGAYASIRTVGQVLNLSDAISQTEARLSLIVDDGGSVEELKNKIFTVSQNTRASFMDTADMISKLGMNAKDAFSGNDELLVFAEQLNKSLVIAGADGMAAESTIYNLTQALSTGVLRGQDLNAVMSNVPNIVQNIADYLDVPLGKIKDMAAEGQISAEVVKNAMIFAADETNAKFESMPMTFAQAWQGIQDDLLMTFQPMLQAIGAGAQFIHDNWSTIEPIFWGLTAAVGAYAIGLGIQTAATWIATGAAQAFFTTLMTNPITWIALAIGVLIGMIYKWVQSVGGLEIAWKIAMNGILTAWDWVQIGFFTGIYWVLDLWDKLKLGIMTASVGIQNFMGDMKTGVLNILQDMVNGAIDIINDFIGILNKIPGVSIEAVQGVTFGTTAQLENDVAKIARANELQAYQDEIEAGMLERDIALNQMKADAFAATALRQTEIDLMKAEVSMKNDNDDLLANMIADMEGVPGNIADIAENSGQIKDSVNVSAEDLKYMRDMAEMETVNRYTTAEIKIEQNNNFGDIHETADLDGVIDYLSESVEEAIQIQSEGVHI